jgi:hypothetical protein
VVEVGAAAAPGGVGEHVDGLAEPDMFGDRSGDLVGVHRRWRVVEVDDRFQQDLATVPEQTPQPGQQDGADVLDPRHSTTSRERGLGQVDVDDRPGPGFGRVERRRPDPHRPS